MTNQGQRVEPNEHSLATTEEKQSIENGSTESIRNPQSAIRNRMLRLLLPAIICLVFLVLILYAAKQHPYGTYTVETDFYQYYAPDAGRLAQGEFPQDTYRGPG